MNQSQLEQVLIPVLGQFGLDLDAIEVVPAGKRRLVRVVVDGDGPHGGGPLLDDIAEATKAISAALDDSDAPGSSPYTLEVSSRGVNRPLTLPRHWRRNRGRLVRLTRQAGEEVTGRIVESSEDSVTLLVGSASQTFSFADIAKALVQVELNRRVEEEN